jgi:hypothetical protein
MYTLSRYVPSGEVDLALPGCSTYGIHTDWPAPPRFLEVLLPPSSAVEEAASLAAVQLWPELAFQLHQAPDLGPVGADIGLDVGGRLLNGSQVDAEQVCASL